MQLACTRPTTLLLPLRFSVRFIHRPTIAYIHRTRPSPSQRAFRQRSAAWFTTSAAVFRDAPPPEERETRVEKPIIRENIYTIPNFLTVSRILACPVLGWAILDGNFHLATSLLVYAGLSDWFDGQLARRYKMQSVLGTILDPAADKTLMTTLVVTTCIKGLLPVPLAVIILGRDVLLSLSAFYIRYTSLPEPKTFTRYWDFSIPSAEVRPTTISKVNTALQLGLMCATTVGPILPIDLYTPFSQIPYLTAVLPLDLLNPLLAMQWTVATTTIWSGLSYIFSKDAVRIVAQRRKKVPPL